jgi:hypothetical protein
MLKSHLGFEGDLAFIEQAIYYGDFSEDPAIQALAYRRRAYENWFTKKYKAALRDAEQGYGLAKSSKAIPKIVHSDTASTLALCQAGCNKTDDATMSLTEARNLFDPAAIRLPCMSYTESILTARSGAVHQHIGLWGEAMTLYEESLNLPDISALGYAEQRINYAKAEVSRDDKPRDMGLCVKLLTEAMTRVEELDSKGFIEKASEVYEMLRLVWPREHTVKQVGRDHFGMR